MSALWKPSATSSHARSYALRSPISDPPYPVKPAGGPLICF